MDINKYEKNIFFDRNEAIYVLHSVDKLRHEELAMRFQLATDEVQEIIIVHSKYEEMIMQTTDR